MKKLTVVLLFLNSLSVKAQKNEPQGEIYYVYDENWKPCGTDSASFMAAVNKLNDTCYEWKYYNYTGPLLSVETYRDKEATILNGYIAFYDKTGLIDSSGFTLNGNRHNTWYFYDDTLFVWLKEEYENGKLVSSVNNYEKQKADIKAGVKSPVLEPGEIEADFPGGTKAWIKYLEKNFQFPERAIQLGVRGTTITLFTVDTAGKTTDLRTLKSIEFSLDKEAIRLIKKAPHWNPAIQKGRKVKAFRKQPLTFS